MLLICAGPDTWRTREKARELQAAFIAKHDPQGVSTNVLPDADFSAILNALGTSSLFAQKRFIRVNGLFEKLKIADVRALAKRLEADADQSILVTLETE